MVSYRWTGVGSEEAEISSDKNCVYRDSGVRANYHYASCCLSNHLHNSTRNEFSCTYINDSHTTKQQQKKNFHALVRVQQSALLYCSNLYYLYPTYYYFLLLLTIHFFFLIITIIPSFLLYLRQDLKNISGTWMIFT